MKDESSWVIHALFEGGNIPTCSWFPFMVGFRTLSYILFVSLLSFDLGEEAVVMGALELLML